MINAIVHLGNHTLPTNYLPVFNTLGLWAFAILFGIIIIGGSLCLWLRTSKEAEK
jgi:hypothetical protein